MEALVHFCIGNVNQDPLPAGRELENDASPQNGANMSEAVRIWETNDGLPERRVFGFGIGYLHPNTGI